MDVAFSESEPFLIPTAGISGWGLTKIKTELHVSEFLQLIDNNKSFLVPEFLHHTLDNRMMEYWNVGFEKGVLIF